MKIITAAQLQDRLAATPSPLLLHVLPEEHFMARRIAGALNACTYETAFIEQVTQLANDKAIPIIVYGEGAPSLDSADAAKKLADASYSNVSDFRGGLREWESARLPVEGHSSLPSTPVIDGTFRIDTDASVIRWTGQNLFNHHEGTLRLSDGKLQISQGTLCIGEFTIDMDSIACTDLADSTWNAMLIEHLRTSDFFMVKKHPTARFVISSAISIPAASDGAPNHQITGSLTLRGATKELTFPAVIAAADSNQITAQAHMNFDRTDFGSHYGSGKFFAFLGKHIVNDLIQLHLKIQAVRA